MDAKDEKVGIVREIWIEGPRRTLPPEAFDEYMAELRECAKYYAALQRERGK